MDKNKLIEEEKHLQHVKTIARYYYAYVDQKHRGLVRIDDLESAGYEGLVEAAQEYREDGKATFKTYSTKWIKGRIIKELYFYLNKDVLLFDNPEDQVIVSETVGVEEQAMQQFDISAIPEKEQIRIIRKKLKEYKLSEDEITVYCAVNGIGRCKVTNLFALTRELHQRETQIRRLRQSGEEKIRKAIS